MKTKEKIIDKALKLFSQYGFDAVSVRDIAKEVGIKDSSLYNHFASKQEIFDTIVEVCFERAKNYFRQQQIPFSIGEDVSCFSHCNFEDLVAKIVDTFRYFFEDEYNQMFRKLLLLSQFQSEKIQQIYRQLYFEYPVQFQSNLFAVLIQLGEFKKEDPYTMAMDFYGAIFMLLHTCDNLEQAKPAIVAHLQQFVQHHKR